MKTPLDIIAHYAKGGEGKEVKRDDTARARDVPDASEGEKARQEVG